MLTSLFASIIRSSDVDFIISFNNPLFSSRIKLIQNKLRRFTVVLTCIHRKSDARKNRKNSEKSKQTVCHDKSRNYMLCFSFKNKKYLFHVPFLFIDVG